MFEETAILFINANAVDWKVVLLVDEQRQRLHSSSQMIALLSKRLTIDRTVVNFLRKFERALYFHTKINAF